MADRFHVQTGSRRTPAKQPADDALEHRARMLVNLQHQRPDAPFRRMIDFWFLAIAWAVAKDIDPVDDTGKEIISIGTGDPGKHIELDAWQLTLLNALYLRDLPKFDDEADLRTLDVTGGRYNADTTPSGQSEVIKNANRYAIAGWEPLLDVLDDQEEAGPDMGVPQVITFQKLAVTYSEANEAFRETFKR